MKRPFEAVTVQYVDDAGTGERLNVGMVLVSEGYRFARAMFVDSTARLSAAFPAANVTQLRKLARAIEASCEEWERTCGELPLLPPASIVAIVRAAVAPTDGGLYLQDPMRGITDDPERSLRDLFTRIVDRGPKDERPPVLYDLDIWRVVAGHIQDRAIIAKLSSHVISGTRATIESEHAWKNGRWNSLVPVSLDLRDPDAIRNKGLQWYGKVQHVRPLERNENVIFVVGTPSAESPDVVRLAAKDAVALLSEDLDGAAEVVLEKDADRVASRIVNDLAADHE